MDQAFDPLKTQHLFLLIGANPLPNYVAAMLLAQDGGTVYLLHTHGLEGTAPFAENLRFAIRRDRPHVQVVLHEVDDSDSGDIIQKVNAILETVQGTVGLNYTGGTKPMATHTYRAIEKRFPNALFTYLDPRELRMIVDQRGDVPMQSVFVGNRVSLNLENLVALHGYTLNKIQRTPRCENLCQAIAQTCSQTGGFKNWKRYADGPLDRLPNIQDYPDIVHALEELCGDTPTPSQVAQKLGFQELTSCRKFFQGTWLEEYTLAQLAKAAAQVGMTSFGKELKPTRKNHPSLELDLAAMYGYQLFAISCRATDNKDKAKEHLFEVFARAQQLGGEEARFAVVCCMPNPSELQAEIEESWYAPGRVRVFGQDELLHLADYLQDWFVTANQR